MPENELCTLKERWLTTGSFHDEQAYLSARVRMKDARFVYLDPDGTLAAWIAIVVRCDTGVVYGTQCGGVATEERFVEGYLVPVGGSKCDVEGGGIEIGPFVHVFHEDSDCKWDWNGRDLPPERQTLLSNLVKSIPFWGCSLDREDRRYPIQIDNDRAEEIAEAWIPIKTPDGAGVLVYKNCD